MSARRDFGSFATQKVHRRLIRIFAGCTGHFVGFVVLQLMFAYFVKTGNCAPITFILAIRRNRVLPTNTADLMMDPSSHFGIAGLPFNIVISIAQSSLNKPCVKWNYISFQRPVWTIVKDPDETAPQCSWKSNLIRDYTVCPLICIFWKH